MKKYANEGFDDKLNQILDSYEIYFEDYLFKVTGFRYVEMPESAGLKISINDETGEFAVDNHESAAALALTLIEVIKRSDELVVVINWLDLTSTIYGYLKNYESESKNFTLKEILKKKHFANARAKGVEANKTKSEKNIKYIVDMNNDLLKHVDFARKTLNERAEYIAKKCDTNYIKMVNGSPYSLRYIKDLITGK